MDDRIAFISSNGKGQVKLEYIHNGNDRILTWSARGSKTLETAYDATGAILVQKVVDLDSEGIAKTTKDILNATGLEAAQKTEFIEVRLKKPCPKCGEYALASHAEAFPRSEEVPIMPIYYCTSCKGRGYYLTDQYLEYLVENNRELFSEQEVSALSSDKGAFLGELRENIIRIFASKRIMRIK
ncbi:MAG: hypothetical protein ABSE71_02545 [Candidatus Micrarchaeaceae archaeon]|jgi:ribosomal protein S27AE|nr:hypothetical protein [Candidatus Micrarchaeota archaeon]